MPGVWKLRLRTFPYLKFFCDYVICIFLINSLNVTWSLLSDDYCNRNSPVYNAELRNLKVLKQIIKDTNTSHKGTMEGKAK